MIYRPIFKCHGGKYYLYKWVIAHFPLNYTEMTYVEGCGGGASVLLNKQPSKVEVYNDYDPNIAGIVQELAAEDASEFIQALRDVPYTQERFDWAVKESEAGEGMEQSVAELVRRRFSRGGLRQAFAWSDRLRGGQPGDVNAWETFKSSLDALHARLQNVEIRCQPVIELVKEYDSPETLFYIDPPYLPATRSAPKTYVREMSEQDHIELADALNYCEGKVVLSGYQSSLYCNLYKGWRLTAKPVKNHAGQNKDKQTRIECIWCNF